MRKRGDKLEAKARGQSHATLGRRTERAIAPSNEAGDGVNKRLMRISRKSLQKDNMGK